MERDNAVGTSVDSVAEALQRSLLPDDVHDGPTVDLRTRYRPGGSARVGGDWYDVVLLQNGSLGLVIGDVAGHGVLAAAVMGQVRNALRAFAGEGYPPSAMVERLNHFVFENGPSEMATLCFAALDPTTGGFEMISAGHPPPLLVRAGGEVEWCAGTSGPPVGIDPHSRYHQIDAVLAPGDVVVLYTNGLVARRHESLDVGLERLRNAATTIAPETDLDGICDHLLSTLLGDISTDDDVAVLALRYAGNVPGTLRWRRPARASELGPMRRVLSAWLQDAGVNAEDVTVIAVAVSEAATNAIEHAYTNQEGWVDLEADVDDEAVTLMVRDGGRFRPKAPGGGGRGLGLIGRLMDEFELRRSNEGTEVWMRRMRNGRTGT
ncbi:MAG: protein serine/threonine phosphatase [Actinomycetia bacterium]|nr:protein serine/threonine phosphatase [Actinomycetes bacterium]